MGTREYLLDKATKEGKLEGRLEGKLEGRLEERTKAEAEKLADKKASARKMLENGFEVALISDIIGLSISEVEDLK
ncbi:hypothetical protein [Sphingobacterium deserti]|uniref:Uncharacterized protein n=1 Tax=Sphingobacterium deserti TaxID=1229276 RepID=A0A0B8T5V4_9SPHI|nr:hypothetical protein [Sphingobacterium deserti]KGE13139.1 hypothetical protein DI53_2975 [Sphingobacterium deserti]